MSVCRVCLCSRPRKDITQSYVITNGEKQSFNHVMLYCLGIEVLDTDMTSKLCLKCYRKIEEFYQFKTLAIQNDAQLRLISSTELKNEVFLNGFDIKKEEIQDTFYLEEPLIYVDDVTNAGTDFYEMKEEWKQEDQSDNEVLSVVKQAKYQSSEETKENALEKKKIGRPKKEKTSNKEVSKSKICDQCGKEVKDLRAHRLSHISTDERKEYKCDICDKTFSIRAGLRKHIYRRHLAVKQQCHLCNKAVMNLKQHMQITHDPDSLPFVCVTCDRRFLTQSRLVAHSTVHTKDRPFKCEICGSKFRIKLSLDNHRREVHEKERNHLCQFCSKSFFKKHHLNIHLRSHTKEKPYDCPDCGKKLQSSSTLKNHRLIHNDEKSFKCPMCDMCFNTSNYLRAHLVSHKKEKRYPCQYCEVKFHRSDHRKRHEYTAHLRHHSVNADS